MSRLLTLLAVLFVFIAAYLMMRNYHQEGGDFSPINKEAVTLANQSDSNLHEWREFSFKSEHFKVLLPSLPQHVSDKIPDPNTSELRQYETFAAAADNGAAFIVNAISFVEPNPKQSSEEFLKKIIDEMLARNKKNKLNQMKKSTFHGILALDFSFINENLLIEGKVFSHEKITYILSMINKKDAFDKKEWDFFINSFDFVDDKILLTPP